MIPWRHTIVVFYVLCDMRGFFSFIHSFIPLDWMKTFKCVSLYFIFSVGLFFLKRLPWCTILCNLIQYLALFISSYASLLFAPYFFSVMDACEHYVELIHSWQQTTKKGFHSCILESDFRCFRFYKKCQLFYFMKIYRYRFE